MIFSRNTSYAIRALVCLARHRGLGPVLGATIAESENLPAPFLAKLMRELIKAGIVQASRGPGGGFELGREPHEISLWEVHTQYEGSALTSECLLGHGQCSETTPCYMHSVWREPRGVVESVLRRTTIAELVQNPTRLD